MDRLDWWFPEYSGVRSVFVTDVERIADPCGFAAPLYEFKGDRSQFVDFAAGKGPEGMEQYGRRRTG